MTAILVIALIAGTVGISENIVFKAFRCVTPYMIFQYTASGSIGMGAFSGGSSCVLLGVIIHRLIAVT